jgi:hypothetical protein
MTVVVLGFGSGGSLSLPLPDLSPSKGAAADKRENPGGLGCERGGGQEFYTRAARVSRG